LGSEVKDLYSRAPPSSLSENKREEERKKKPERDGGERKGERLVQNKKIDIFFPPLPALVSNQIQSISG